ncbi:hypothetical protein DPMN_065909 [Dreissena polymorpha]|uniref:Uncharacterized protein n=1 Tax=Dreissena polymorpha TaxID=45954 RepID=A0A9D3YUE9_DREPO|nr:hypothetical protein DPMN_065909 [Dreissena polymorpha]
MSDRYTSTVHKDWTQKVTSIVFKLGCDFIGTKVLTMFYDHWPINVTNRALTRKTASPPGGHTYRVLTTFYYSHDIRKTDPPHGDHCYENLTENVTSRVLTTFYYSHDIRKTDPPHGGHVFQRTGSIFKFYPDIIRENALTRFHENLTENVTSRVLTRKIAPPPGDHFHEDWTQNVTSRVLFRLFFCIIRKTSPLPGGHVFQPTRTIFKISRDIIRKNVLIKFHEYWTKDVTSRVLTWKLP